MINSFAALLTCFTFAWIAPPLAKTPTSPMAPAAPVAATAPPATSHQTVATPPPLPADRHGVSGEAAPTEAEAVASQLLKRFQTIMSRYQEALDLFGPLVEHIHKVARPVVCLEEHQLLHSTLSATRRANDRAAAASRAAYSQLVAYHPQDQSVAPMATIYFYDWQVNQMIAYMHKTDSAFQALTECMSPPSQPKPPLPVRTHRM